MSKERKPGSIPPGRIGVYGSGGHLVGHVGPHATAITAQRLAQQLGATLGKKDGRTAWLTPRDQARPRARNVAESANHKSARGSVRAPKSRRG